MEEFEWRTLTRMLATEKQVVALDNVLPEAVFGTDAAENHSRCMEKCETVAHHSGDKGTQCSL